MKIVLTFLVMVALCAVVPAATVISDFKSSGEGTMSHYSYLKEPKLEESGYKLGYKAGSFSYLVDGTITLNDSIAYYDGQIDAEHGPGDNLNSTLYLKQYVDFDGTKGISEFYAKGFFPSNRALSAWKKIRYDDLSHNFSKRHEVIYLSSVDRTRSNNIPSVCYNQDAMKADLLNRANYSCEQTVPEDRNGDGHYNLGPGYSSSKILVNAEVGIGPNNQRNTGNEYDFKYRATVTDGVIEIRDATGWTNRTGSLRIDWERDSVMKGNFSVENDLKSRGLFFPAAGEDEPWLVCCFDGTRPPIENQKYSGVLAPEKLLPQKSFNSSTGKPENISCTPEECKGFECIFTYAKAERGLLYSARDIVPVVQVQTIEVSNVVRSIDNRPLRYGRNDAEELKRNLTNGSVIEYEITVSYNDALSPLTDITVFDKMPQGLEYIIGSSTVDFEDSPNPFEPVSDDKRTELAYNLTSLIPRGITSKDTIYINLKATVVDNNVAEILANEAYAIGIARNETIRVGVSIKSNTDKASLPKN